MSRDGKETSLGLCALFMVDTFRLEYEVVQESDLRKEAR